MIKIINVYKDSRVMEMTDGSNIGLGVETDNKVDLLRFTFDDLLVGSATLLTDLKDSQGNLVAFPLTLNEDLNSYDLTIAQAIVSEPTLTFQVEIAYDGDKIWHSKQATLQVDECLEIGTGEMPTTISNWLENANLVLDEMEQATRETENLNIEVGTETSTTIPVTFTDKEGNQTTVNIKGAKGERGEQGIQGVPGQNGADGRDATINGVNTLTIEQGQNITITQVGSTMTISSTGGGGGSTNYNDLSNKPSINNVTLQGNKSLSDLGIQPSGDYVTPSDLSSVATSGSYNDLTNKPTIPSKTSDLTNDSGFITNSVDNLTNYYTKSSTDTLLGNKEDKSNKVTSISSSSTDTQYPSAKCVYDSQNVQNTQISTINSQISTINNQVSNLASGSPLVASSTSGMTNTSKVYVNTTDGKWYYYNGSIWVAGGTYQSTGIGENEVKTYNLDTQMIKKITSLGDSQNSLITHTFPFNYSDTSNHINVYQEDSTKSLTLPTGRYMVITKIKINSLTSGATIFFRAGGRYKIGSGSTSNQMVSENIHDATFTYQEVGTYKYCWGTINATDTISSFRPLVVFVNQSGTNPIAGEYYIDKFWIFKVDDNSDVFYNDVLQRIDFYEYQESYPIINLIQSDKESIVNSVTYLPNYWETYIDNVINNFQPSDKELSFIFQTDHHILADDEYKNPVINAIKTSNVLLHNLPLELNLFGGDYVANGSSTTKQNYEDYLRLFNKELKYEDKVVMLRGNHEVNTLNSSDNEKLTDSEIFNIIGKKYITNNLRVITNNNIPNPMYGYIDYDFQKIRLVFVNTSDGYDQNLKIGMGNMNTTQMQWLADNAFTLPSGKTDYQVIVVGHYPIYNFSDGSEVEDGRLNGFKSLLEAFKSGSNLNYTSWGNNYKVIKDFRTQGAKTLICYLCGHTHIDQNYTTSGGILQIATTNAGYYNKTTSTGTINELAYDIVRINPISKTIIMQRIGNGNNRNFTYN